MNTNAQNMLIVTDLDGSLLDHYTYSFAPAKTLIEELVAGGIPIVPCSSKTRAEISVLRTKLGLEHCPYIVENGAAIYLPQRFYANPGEERVGTDWRHAFGKNRPHWQDVLLTLPDELRANYRKFSKMTVGQIADLTGLSLEDAALAAKREFGEPIHWRGSDEAKQALIDALAEKGAHVLQGGRFLHVAGEWDKGRALNWLADYLTPQAGDRPVTVALGDSHNDVAMLEAADYAVIIRSPVHGAPEVLREGPTIYTTQTGPKGWVEGVREVLKQCR